MRQIRRIFSAILVLLGVVIVVPAFAGLASAHHSNISASVSCEGTVSWTATSWSTGLEGSNKDILVSKTINGVKTDIQHGVFNAPAYAFSGTFAWPANTTSIIISSLPIAAWGNGVVSPVGSSTTISKPVNCAGQPGVAKAVACVNQTAGHGDGKVTVTLTNTAGLFASPVVFKVFNPDQAVAFTNYTVNQGGSTAVPFSPLADGSHFVKIVVGTTDYTQNFTVSCDSPVPAVTNSASCVNGDGQIVVTLKNTGGKEVTFVVTNPKTGTTENVPVAADGGTATRTFGGFADGTYTVVITIGSVHYDQTFTVDCDKPIPAATTATACDNTSHDGSIVITLKNTGTEAVVFHVTNPFTNIVTDVPVGIGGSVDVPFTGFSDGPHAVVITAFGQTLTQTFTTKCDLSPTYSHTETCVNGDGSISVSMKNDGDDVNAVFVLNGTTYTLAPGATQTVVIGGLADGPLTIPFSVNGAVQNIVITVDCDRPGQPAVDIAQSCANEDGQVIVTLKNIGGQLPLTFIVEGTSYIVPANGTVLATVSGILDGNQTIHIKTGTTVLDKPVTINCDMPPTVGSTQSCVNADNGISDGQVVVTLNNNGDDLPVTFLVNTVPTTVPPKTSTTVTVGHLTDGPHTIDVFVGTLRLGLDQINVACDHAGSGDITIAQTCVNNDGQVTINLIATGGELPVVFTVNGATYSVAPNTTTPVVISGLPDLAAKITVLAGGKDLSFTPTTKCDLAPTSSFSEACANNFDDTVTVTIGNPGDDVDVTFTVNGTDYVLHPGQTLPVVIANLADGPNTITLAINGVPQDNIVVQSDCNPTFSVAAVCNSVDVNGAVTGYWFNLTNTENTPVTVTYNGGGTATLAAGQTVAVQSATAPLLLMHNGQQIAQAAASQATCERTINVTKDLQGAPATGETYTIQVSRLVNGAYVPETTFNINAGETKTINLPSTLDPAGINYKIDEINAGTANTSTVSPNQLTLAGHLGETVSVIVTNGYASVQIDKTTSTTTVLAGGQITYTMQVTNTGGLTLNPVVVSDRLPAMTELATASVAGGAGQCELTQTTRPQLLTCTMSGPLAPGAVSNLITVVVNVDTNVATGTTILNQAMVHGAYSDGAVMSGIATDSGTLTCIPAVAGTVCDLSAQVGVPVSEVLQASSPPVPTATADAVVVQLPRTGAEHLREMLAFGFGAILLGGAMLLGRRRLGAR